MSDKASVLAGDRDEPECFSDDEMASLLKETRLYDKTFTEEKDDEHAEEQTDHGDDGYQDGPLLLPDES